LKKTSLVLVIALIGSLFLSMSAFAETSEELANPFVYEFTYEGYDYSITFEQYTGVTEKVFSEDWENWGEKRKVVEVPVFKTPSGSYKTLSYQFETNNPDARYLTVEFASFFGGQLNFDEGMEIVDGTVSNDFRYFTPEDEIAYIYLYIYDEDYNMIVYAYNMYVMFDSFKHSEMLAANKPQVPETATAVPSNSRMYVDDKEVSFQAYTINGNNYFKLRDIAFVLNNTEKSFAVGWDGINNAITIETDEAYEPVGGELAVANNPTTQTAKLSTSTIYFNGTPVEVTAYTINGNNYVKLRDIAAMVNFEVYYDSETKAIHIYTWHFYYPDFY